MRVDIWFNCPVCGQRMVIDGAGAGLVIQCAKCGRDVRVPSAVAPNPGPGSKPAPLPESRKEPTDVLRWSPPVGSPRKEPKK